MHISLLQVTASSLAYIVAGGFVVAFSMFTLLVRETFYLNHVVLGTLFGILMGPHCANAFNPRTWGTDNSKVTLEILRVVLAVELFASGVELPKAYLLKHAKGLFIMVAPTMAFGWIIIAGMIYSIFPALDFVSCLVISACLTPTDVIVCAAVLGGKFAIKNVPVNLRQLLIAESGSNDGLAYPFLSVSIYLTAEASYRVAIAKWFLVGCLHQVVLGTVIGATIGFTFNKLMQFSSRKGYIDGDSYVAQFLALTILTIGITSTVGSDDLLAAFAVGSAICWDGHFKVRTEDATFPSVISLVLNCGCFIYIGAWMPFGSFNTPALGITPWRLALLLLSTLCLRRIPPLLLLYKWVPEIASWREALFSGHFGPMGIGAIFISTLALSRLPKPQNPPQNQQEMLAATLQTIVSFIVLGSILIHGLSIPFFCFGRRMSYTLSQSQVWTSTSQQTVQPDWLLWVRRVQLSSAAENVEAGCATSVATQVVGTQIAPEGSIHSELRTPEIFPDDRGEMKNTPSICGDSVFDSDEDEKRMEVVVHSSGCTIPDAQQSPFPSEG